MVKQRARHTTHKREARTAARRKPGRLTCLKLHASLLGKGRRRWHHTVHATLRGGGQTHWWPNPSRSSEQGSGCPMQEAMLRKTMSPGPDKNLKPPNSGHAGGKGCTWRGESEAATTPGPDARQPGWARQPASHTTHKREARTAARRKPGRLTCLMLYASLLGKGRRRWRHTVHATLNGGGQTHWWPYPSRSTRQGGAQAGVQLQGEAQQRPPPGQPRPGLESWPQWQPPGEVAPAALPQANLATGARASRVHQAWPQTRPLGKATACGRLAGRGQVGGL